MTAAPPPIYAVNVPIQSQRRYTAAWERFPPRCRISGVPVRWGRTRRGFYDPAVPEIALPQHASAGQFAHEWGHVVMDRVLHAAEWHEWEAFWAAHPAWMPTPYARTNAFEGWAECCRCWVMAVRLRAEVRQVLTELCGEGG